jgi:hypothetical protein
VRHLSWKTPEENHADKIAHGTSGKGEKNPSAILNWEKVTEIRSRYTGARGELTSMGLEYGVCAEAIGRIIHNRVWKVSA